MAKTYKTWKLKKEDLHNKLNEYSEVANWCNSSNNKYAIEEDGDYYKVVELKDTNKVYQLECELEATLKELSSLDYIATKIVTGRATKEEYADKIALMDELADKVNELKGQISKLK